MLRVSHIHIYFESHFILFNLSLNLSCDKCHKHIVVYSTKRKKKQKNITLPCQTQCSFTQLNILNIFCRFLLFSRTFSLRFCRLFAILGNKRKRKKNTIDTIGFIDCIFLITEKKTIYKTKIII